MQTVSTDGSRRLYAVTGKAVASGEGNHADCFYRREQAAIRSYGCRWNNTVTAAMKLRGLREGRGPRKLFIPIVADDSTQLLLTSGFWPRVRARALRAPVFLGSLPRPTGRCAPLRPSQLRCSPQTKKNYFQKQNVSLQAQTRATRGICFPTGLRCALLSYAVPS